MLVRVVEAVRTARPITAHFVAQCGASCPENRRPIPNLGVESHVRGWRSHAISPARETLSPGCGAAARQPEGDDRAWLLPSRLP